MKKLAFFLLAVLLLLSGCGTSQPAGENQTAEKKEENIAGNSAPNDKKEDQKYVIGISQIVEHPSLNAAQEGFKKVLTDEFGDKVRFDVQYAQGDPSTNTTIAQKFVNDGVNLILGISTPSAQAIVEQAKDKNIPVLFTAITDPLGAKLVPDLKKPGGMVTGTSDTHPDAIKNTMAVIKKFFPNAKKVGMVYNSGEQNSRVNAEKAIEAMKGIGLSEVVREVSSSSEVKQAAESLVGQVDVIYIPKDNTVVSALETVIAVADQNKIPLFVGEGDSVKRGGFAGYGFEYFDLGYTTGKMAIDILKNGKKPGDIPVGFPENLDLVINKESAEKQGIDLSSLPKDIVEKAVMIEKRTGNK